MIVEDKLALITGGGSGIGLATAQALVDAGARVVIVGRDEVRLRLAQQQIPALFIYPCDIQQPTQRQEMVATLHDTFGPIDILVNNAGMQVNGDFTDPDIHAESRMETEIAVNLTAPIALYGSLQSDLLRGGQTALVNICSILGYVPRARSTIYSVTKAGLSAFGQALRVATQGSQMLVVEVIPPLVDTALAQQTEGRKVPPSEVADAILRALQENKPRVSIGISRLGMLLRRFSPALMSHIINKPA